MSSEKDRLITITDPLEDRYASLRLLDWWDYERIRGAHVMVIGAGALGNEVLKNLALLGVGHLFIVDFDTIEASNLTRSILFRAQDGGQPKAKIAAERVKMINEDIECIAFNGDITRSLGAGVYRRMDVVIGCLDNRAARRMANEICYKVNVPWVDGALSAQDGLVRVFLPPEGACYECTLTEQDYEQLNIRYSCPPGFAFVTGRQPTMPTTASIIGAMQVQEALKLLLRQKVKGGRAVYYSWSGVLLSELIYSRRVDCPMHDPYGQISPLPARRSELTLASLATLIGAQLPGNGVIYLPEVIVASFYCPNCKRTEDVYKPYLDVVPGQVSCSNCSKNRVYDLMSTCTTGEELPDIPLMQLSIPILAILTVRSGSDWYYFELSNDEDDLLQNWW